MFYFRVIIGILIFIASMKQFISFIKEYKKNTESNNFYKKYRSLIYSLIGIPLVLYSMFSQESYILRELLPLILLGPFLLSILDLKYNKD